MEADDITGPGLFHRFSLLPKELLRRRETEPLTRACVRDLKSRLEAPRADPGKRDPIPVLRVHIRLNLEDKSRKRGIGGINGTFPHRTRRWGGGIDQEAPKKRLNPKIR